MIINTQTLQSQHKYVAWQSLTTSVQVSNVCYGKSAHAEMKWLLQLRVSSMSFAFHVPWQSLCHQYKF